MPDTLKNIYKTMKKQYRIATFNCQGLATSESKCTMLANDFEKYKLDALTVQETHLSGYGIKTLISDNNKKHLLYYSGSTKSEKGIGIVLSPDIKATFTPVDERICQV